MKKRLCAVRLLVPLALDVAGLAMMAPTAEAALVDPSLVIQVKDVSGKYDPNSERAQWFKSLRVPDGAPGSGSICCDISDGYPVEAEQRGDQWFAMWQGSWTPVPTNIVLHTTSIEEKAYLFVYAGNMRCFIPPLRGS